MIKGSKVYDFFPCEKSRRWRSPGVGCALAADLKRMPTNGKGKRASRGKAGFQSELDLGRAGNWRKWCNITTEEGGVVQRWETNECCEEEALRTTCVKVEREKNGNLQALSGQRKKNG